MLRLIITMIIVFNSPIHSAYQSCMTLSSMGNEFQPQNNIDLIESTTAYSTIFCVASCNWHRSCYAFDFDSISGRCRLFRSDLTTGSIIPSSSATSTVGLVQLSPVLFLPIHNQPCGMCAKNRYEVCYSNTSICQCPLRTYWSGSMCLLQLSENKTCSQLDACRVDFNLTCSTDGYGVFIKCSPGMPHLFIQANSIRFTSGNMRFALSDSTERKE